MITLNADGKPIETKEVLIDVSALEAEKSRLEKSLTNIIEPKTKPDEETLDFWNSMIPRVPVKEVQDRIDVIDSKLSIIDSL